MRLKTRQICELRWWIVAIMAVGLSASCAREWGTETTFAAETKLRPWKIVGEKKSGYNIMRCYYYSLLPPLGTTNLICLHMKNLWPFEQILNWPITSFGCHLVFSKFWNLLGGREAISRGISTKIPYHPKYHHLGRDTITTGNDRSGKPELSPTVLITAVEVRCQKRKPWCDMLQVAQMAEISFKWPCLLILHQEHLANQFNVGFDKHEFRPATWLRLKACLLVEILRI
jgi:hypothetical protein